MMASTDQQSGVEKLEKINDGDTFATEETILVQPTSPTRKPLERTTTVRQSDVEQAPFETSVLSVDTDSVGVVNAPDSGIPLFNEPEEETPSQATSQLHRKASKKSMKNMAAAIKEAATVPTLVLEPYQDTSFKTKVLDLLSPIKIGRKANSKMGPEAGNGIFDSKVLSRNHAEIYYETGKVWIKDVKSSNGTFVNGKRLSDEGMASLPFELKAGDILEFGIDIMNNDGSTILYHKVSCKVNLVDDFMVTQDEESSEQTKRVSMGNVAMDNVFGLIDREIQKSETMNAELEQLKTKMADVHIKTAHVVELNKKLEQANAMMKGWKEKYETLVPQVELLKREKNVALEQVQQAESKAQQEKTRDAHALQQMTEQLESLQSTLQKLEQGQKDEMEKLVQSHQHQVEIKETQHEHTVKMLKEDLMKLEKVNLVALQQVEEFKQENEILADKIKEMNTEKAEWMEKEMKSVESKYQNEIQDLKEKIQFSDEKAGLLNQEVGLLNEWKAKCHTLESEQASLMDKLKATQSELNSALKECEEIKNEKDQVVQEHLEQRDSLIKEMEEKLQQAESRLADVTSKQDSLIQTHAVRVDTLEKEKQEMEANRSKWDSDKAELVACLASLQKQLDEKEDKFKEMEAVLASEYDRQRQETQSQIELLQAHLLKVQQQVELKTMEAESSLLEKEMLIVQVGKLEEKIKALSEEKEVLSREIQEQKVAVVESKGWTSSILYAVSMVLAAYFAYIIFIEAESNK